MNGTPRRPVLLGVGGDSGSGKTTITRGLVQLFGAGNVTSICLDDYHKLDRNARAAAGVTALNPAANDLALLEEHMAALRRGESVLKPVYDHSTGTFGEPEEVHPKPWIIVRGLFPLFTERLRRTFDLKVWLEPDTELKYHWKVQRDVAQRGYTVEQVIRHIVDRQDDLRRYILPQAGHADLQVQFHPPEGFFHTGEDHDPAQRELHVRLTVRPETPVAPVLDSLMGIVRGGSRPPASSAGRPGIRLGQAGVNGHTAAVLEVDGGLDPATTAPLLEVLLRRLAPLDPDQPGLGTFLAGGRTPARSHTLMVTQLLIANAMLAAVQHEGSRPSPRARMVD
ncbi:phosphoribulokinase [Limnochorda pilosa]|uniref:Phosphoribulokinase n=1 Tax=Limnochorda pilosa TaxID=1555112 RepID=A0A0K2SQ37_LIMPI|nr:phosphoribulokinase [Limnochorda pilosa]BAS29238.1 phosphoribulokinase [Limnochorda pilosa]